jgi:murein DD-endopeptidase MepM/ murein hydrolase activator NlpD
MATNTPQLSARRTVAAAIGVLLLFCAAPTDASAYGWPLKPFHRQHPVRGFFGDPRIDWEIPHVRKLHRFHFGVDVSAPDGTAVYATASGAVSVRGEVVSVTRGDGVVLEYWHVRPLVRSGQRAVAYRTVVGRVERGWGHVHFSERRGASYVNPLRRGAMAPYVDGTAPVVRRLRVRRDGQRTSRFQVAGRVDLLVDCLDVTPLSVPAPWNDKPVTPALVRWRLTGRRGAVLPWRTAIDFRRTIPPDAAFHTVFAAGTRQNRSYRPGQYLLLLAQGWNSETVRDGVYRLELVVADAAGNRTQAVRRLVVSNDS